MSNWSMRMDSTGRHSHLSTEQPRCPQRNPTPGRGPAPQSAVGTGQGNPPKPACCCAAQKPMAFIDSLTRAFMTGMLIAFPVMRPSCRLEILMRVKPWQPWHFISSVVDKWRSRRVLQKPCEAPRVAVMVGQRSIWRRTCSRAVSVSTMMSHISGFNLRRSHQAKAFSTLRRRVTV